jgi:hypothetical protein
MADMPTTTDVPDVPTVTVVHKVIVLLGNTKGGSITLLLTSCLTGLESAV